MPTVSVRGETMCSAKTAVYAIGLAFCDNG